MKTRVIAVANNKGGVGKTTTAGNLAYGLSRMLIAEDGSVAGNVLIVDLDPQGNQSDFFGVRDRARGKCVSRVLKNPQSTSALRDTLISCDRSDEGLPRPNLYLFPASRNLESEVQGLNVHAFMNRHSYDIDSVLENALGILHGRFDFVIIDCPPKLDVLKPAVYNYADEVIVPSIPDHMSVVGTKQHTEDMYQFVKRNPKKFKARLSLIIPTIADMREVMAKQYTDHLREVYGRLCKVTDPIPRSVVVREPAGVGGQTLMEYAPNSKPAAAYDSVVRTVFYG